MILPALCILSFAANIPLGYWRKRVKKFSIQWFIAVHAAVPLIIAMRLFFGVSNWFIPLFIALAVAGQLLGGKVQ
ncbi:MAG: hypothetical protein LBP51_00740 [Deferribacteraceae bacterium]|jgi:hypothetical protein|nr:hypothetical protein [Deferribacteraceae bacterium]